MDSFLLLLGENVENSGSFAELSLGGLDVDQEVGGSPAGLQVELGLYLGLSDLEINVRPSWNIYLLRHLQLLAVVQLLPGGRAGDRAEPVVTLDVLQPQPVLHLGQQTRQQPQPVLGTAGSLESEGVRGLEFSFGVTA